MAAQGQIGARTPRTPKVLGAKAVQINCDSRFNRDGNRMKRGIRSPAWINRLLQAAKLDNIKVVRRVIVSVVGATVVLIGIALLVLPGPAFVVIPVGLAILATEYAWARRWLRKVRRIASDVVSGKEQTASRSCVNKPSRRAQETCSRPRRRLTGALGAIVSKGALRTPHTTAGSKPESTI